MMTGVVPPSASLNTDLASLRALQSCSRNGVRPSHHDPSGVAGFIDDTDRMPLPALMDLGHACRRLGRRRHHCGRRRPDPRGPVLLSSSYRHRRVESKLSSCCPGAAAVTPRASRAEPLLVDDGTRPGGELGSTYPPASVVNHGAPATGRS
jgi:hypothetical protein